MKPTYQEKLPFVGQKMTEIFDDIRKIYLFRSPCPALQQHIEFFSESSPEATAQYIKEDHFSVKLFPSFTPTIWINLGAPYQLDNGHRIKMVDKTADVLLLRSTIWERKNFPTDHIFTIKFHPLGFEAIFGISQARIGHDILDAKEILGEHVIKKLKVAATLEEKSRFLENFFLENLRKNSQHQFHLQCVKKSMEIFLRSGMQSRLSEMASRLNVSEKTFYRYFYKIVGTNPKSFFLITRCRTALTNYKSNPGAFSPYDFGYYDFGHFSKEVKWFTGSNLTSFRT